MYKTHPKIWSQFLVPRFIKNTVNSYSCIRCTPSFDIQFWGKKVRLIHETVRYVFFRNLKVENPKTFIQTHESCHAKYEHTHGVYEPIRLSNVHHHSGNHPVIRKVES